MADSLTEQVFNLLRRFGKHFNRKVSEIAILLINHKNAGSLGALAGFAIAIAFTWKFLRSPSRHQRSQRKRIGSASTGSDGTQANEAASNSEFHHAEQHLNDIDAVHEVHHPVELTLGQIVRKKLSGGRRMTCQLLGVILEESSPEELQKHATVKPSVVEVLLEISKSCDLYLMERILDDESGERALSALEDAGLFRTSSLIKDKVTGNSIAHLPLFNLKLLLLVSTSWLLCNHEQFIILEFSINPMGQWKVLFCSTENGRMSFVRQLEPDWHVDTNLEIVSQLARFIRFQLHIWPISSSNVASNVFSSTSLEQYFSCLDQY